MPKQARNHKHKKTLQEKLNVSDYVYHSVTIILIGFFAALVVLAGVAYATRNTLPTRYFLMFVSGKLGIKLDTQPTIETQEPSFYN